MRIELAQQEREPLLAKWLSTEGFNRGFDIARREQAVAVDFDTWRTECWAGFGDIGRIGCKRRGCRGCVRECVRRQSLGAGGVALFVEESVSR